MHTTFRLGFGLPYHPNVHPVFVSFHINRIKVLTPEAIEYLQAHGPIGCRDWTTVDLLLSAGVDAFFTGCLTTTVNAVFPELDDVDRSEAAGDRMRRPAAVARRRVKGRTEVVTHGAARAPAGRTRGGRPRGHRPAGGYQRRYRRIVTSRLHSYLPGDLAGAGHEVLPEGQGDVRFDGLYGIDPRQHRVDGDAGRHPGAARRHLRTGVSPARTETVRAGWRELTAPLVDEARDPAGRAVHARAPSVRPPGDGGAGRRRHVLRSARTTARDDVDIALSIDENLARSCRSPSSHCSPTPTLRSVSGLPPAGWGRRTGPGSATCSPMCG